MMATVVWWAVCYSPADIVYSVATNKVSACNGECMQRCLDTDQEKCYRALEPLGAEQGLCKQIRLEREPEKARERERA